MWQLVRVAEAQDVRPARPHAFKINFLVRFAPFRSQSAMKPLITVAILFAFVEFARATCTPDDAYGNRVCDTQIESEPPTTTPSPESHCECTEELARDHRWIQELETALSQCDKARISSPRDDLRYKSGLSSRLDLK